jgi:hypothetical protein
MGFSVLRESPAVFETTRVEAAVVAAAFIAAIVVATAVVVRPAIVAAAVRRRFRARERGTPHPRRLAVRRSR